MEIRRPFWQKRVKLRDSGTKAEGAGARLGGEGIVSGAYVVTAIPRTLQLGANITF
jgi:hypothetical protein